MNTIPIYIASMLLVTAIDVWVLSASAAQNEDTTVFLCTNNTRAISKNADTTRKLLIIQIGRRYIAKSAAPVCVLEQLTKESIAQARTFNSGGDFKLAYNVHATIDGSRRTVGVQVLPGTIVSPKRNDRALRDVLRTCDYDRAIERDGTITFKRTLFKRCKIGRFTPKRMATNAKGTWFWYLFCDASNCFVRTQFAKHGLILRFPKTVAAYAKAITIDVKEQLSGRVALDLEGDACSGQHCTTLELGG